MLLSTMHFLNAEACYQEHIPSEGNLAAELGAKSCILSASEVFCLLQAKPLPKSTCIHH